MKRIAIFCFTLLFLLLSTSCDVTNSRYRTPAQQASSMLQLGIQRDESLYEASQNAQLPFPIKKALIPGLDSSENLGGGNTSSFSGLYGKKFNINVNNIDASLFFKNLAKAVPYSIVVDPNVTGNITLKLKDVSITDILEALRDVYGFDYRQTSYGFLVLPAELQTQTFHINYLDIVRNSSSYTQISSDELINVLPTTTSGDVSNNSSSTTTNGSSSSTPTTPTSTPGVSQSQVNTSTKIDFWADLTTSLQAYIGTDKGRSIVVNPASGTIVIRAFPNEIRQVSEFLDQIQSSMSREVVLEVKLLEVQLNDQYSAGINWEVFGFKQGSVRDSESPVTNSAVSASPLTTINVHGDNFINVMRLLEEQGNVQTIANPRVLTINNQQAVIRIGTDQFFVTGITTNVNNSGTTNTVTTASVSLTPFFSGVILDITPQISRNGEILLHLHPVVSSVEDQVKKINIGATEPMELPLAKNTIREYDSIVRAQNQQVVLIGGLTQNTLKEDVLSTPGLGRIPFFGALFRNTGQSSTKVELVILLKPTILGRGRAVMSEQLPLATERINQLDRGFHAGSLPAFFGNEAETQGTDSPQQDLDQDE